MPGSWPATEAGNGTAAALRHEPATHRFSWGFAPEIPKIADFRSRMGFRSKVLVGKRILSRMLDALSRKRKRYRKRKGE